MFVCLFACLFALCAHSPGGAEGGMIRDTHFAMRNLAQFAFQLRPESELRKQVKVRPAVVVTLIGSPPQSRCSVPTKCCGVVGGCHDTQCALQAKAAGPTSTPTSGCSVQFFDGFAVLRSPIPNDDDAAEAGLTNTIALQRLALADKRGQPTAVHPACVWAAVVIGVRDDLFQELPTSLREGGLIRVTPVMFTQVRLRPRGTCAKQCVFRLTLCACIGVTCCACASRLHCCWVVGCQGINEMQSIHNRVSNTTIQDEINLESLYTLQVCGLCWCCLGSCLRAFVLLQRYYHGLTLFLLCGFGTEPRAWLQSELPGALPKGSVSGGWYVDDGLLPFGVLNSHLDHWIMDLWSAICGCSSFCMGAFILALHLNGLVVPGSPTVEGAHPSWVRNPHAPGQMCLKSWMQLISAQMAQLSASVARQAIPKKNFGILIKVLAPVVTRLLTIGC